MPYTLTLTKSERDAIDWISDRYSNGYALYRLLWLDTPEDCITINQPHAWDESPGWDSDCDIKFRVPEHVAWQIKDNAESEDGHWPCFSPELASKMQTFIDGII
jgi:hypothetical protein